MKHNVNDAYMMALEAAELRNANGGTILVPVANGNAYNPATGTSGPILYSPAPGGSKALATSGMITPPNLGQVVY